MEIKKYYLGLLGNNYRLCKEYIKMYIVRKEKKGREVFAMKVRESVNTGNVSSTHKSSSVTSKGSEFASVLADTIGGTEEGQGVLSSSNVGSVDAVFMVQNVSDSLDQDSKQRKEIERGNNLLDRLEEIRRELLSGSVSKERLISLAQMVRSRREAGIPERLEEIISEIELRVEVELAKISRSLV